LGTGCPWSAAKFHQAPREEVTQVRALGTDLFAAGMIERVWEQ